MFGRTKVDPGQMTPAEKEILRQLMETPGVEDDWNFFKDMSRNTPPPEFFMRGRPEPWWLGIAQFLLVAIIVLLTVCIAIRNWGEWIDLLLFITSVSAMGGLVKLHLFYRHQGKRF